MGGTNTRGKCSKPLKSFTANFEQRNRRRITLNSWRVLFDLCEIGLWTLLEYSTSIKCASLSHGSWLLYLDPKWCHLEPGKGRFYENLKRAIIQTSDWRFDCTFKMYSTNNNMNLNPMLFNDPTRFHIHCSRRAVLFPTTKGYWNFYLRDPVNIVGKFLNSLSGHSSFVFVGQRAELCTNELESFCRLDIRLQRCTRANWTRCLLSINSHLSLAEHCSLQVGQLPRTFISPLTVSCTPH